MKLSSVSPLFFMVISSVAPETELMNVAVIESFFRLSRISSVCIFASAFLSVLLSSVLLSSVLLSCTLWLLVPADESFLLLFSFPQAVSKGRQSPRERINAVAFFCFHFFPPYSRCIFFQQNGWFLYNQVGLFCFVYQYKHIEVKLLFRCIWFFLMPLSFHQT